jgi:hypothetical protein
MIHRLRLYEPIYLYLMNANELGGGGAHFVHTEFQPGQSFKRPVTSPPITMLSPEVAPPSDVDFTFPQD